MSVLEMPPPGLGDESPRPLTLATRIAIIANTKAGAADSVNDYVRAAIKSIRSAGGEVVNNPHEPIKHQLQVAQDMKPAVVIAIGGDGTINAGAQIAIANDAALLVVPAGTMNLVAKDLHLPIDPELIISSATELSVLHIDYATVNGYLFLHSALIGIVPEMSRLREELRNAEGFIETAKHLPELAQAALGTKRIDLTLEAEKGISHQRTRSIAVSNNPLSQNGVISHGRESVASSQLGVYASVHEGPLAPLKLLTSLGTGRLPNDPETLSTNCENLTIHATTPTVPVSLDGEVRDLESPLRFVMHPRDLRVAIPTSFIGSVES